MRLRADWLSRVLTVPYVPILGPTHPDQFTAEMFTDVFADVLHASRAGTALSFDKDRRWSPHKTDTVLIDEIVHRPDHTIIPTLSTAAVGRSRPSTTAANPTSRSSAPPPAATAPPTARPMAESSGSPPTTPPRTPPPRTARGFFSAISATCPDHHRAARW